MTDRKKHTSGSESHLLQDTQQARYATYDTVTETGFCGGLQLLLRRSGGGTDGPGKHPHLRS